jgi:pimeloyl-ACP methyl ester carboxylesterase
VDDDRTPIVLVHGFASSFEHTWAKNGWVDILGDLGRPVTGMDLLGHGSAERPVDPDAYQAIEEQVAAALPDGPLDGVGFSAGGLVLLRLAVSHPGRFRRLALLGVGDNAFGGGDPASVIAALQGEGDPEDIAGEVFRRMAESAGNDPAALVAFLRRASVPLTEADLAAVTVPVLLVFGERDMIGSADRLAAALPQSRLVLVPGVDHFATVSDFAVIDAVVRFLEG